MRGQVEVAKGIYLRMNYKERKAFRDRVNQKEIMGWKPETQEQTDEQEETEMIRYFMQKHNIPHTIPEKIKIEFTRNGVEHGGTYFLSKKTQDDGQ